MPNCCGWIKVRQDRSALLASRCWHDSCQDLRRDLVQFAAPDQDLNALVKEGFITEDIAPCSTCSGFLRGSLAFSTGLFAPGV